MTVSSLRHHLRDTVLGCERRRFGLPMRDRSKDGRKRPPPLPSAAQPPRRRRRRKRVAWRGDAAGAHLVAGRHRLNHHLPPQPAQARVSVSRVRAAGCEHQHHAAAGTATDGDPGSP